MSASPSKTAVTLRRRVAAVLLLAETLLAIAHLYDGLTVAGPGLAESILVLFMAIAALPLFVAALWGVARSASWGRWLGMAAGVVPVAFGANMVVFFGHLEPVSAALIAGGLVVVLLLAGRGMAQVFELHEGRAHALAGEGARLASLRWTLILHLALLPHLALSIGSDELGGLWSVSAKGAIIAASATGVLLLLRGRTVALFPLSATLPGLAGLVALPLIQRGWPYGSLEADPFLCATLTATALAVATHMIPVFRYLARAPRPASDHREGAWGSKRWGLAVSTAFLTAFAAVTCSVAVLAPLVLAALIQEPAPRPTEWRLDDAEGRLFNELGRRASETDLQEWWRRVERASPTPAMREMLDENMASQLWFDGHRTEALAHLEGLIREGPPHRERQRRLQLARLLLQLPGRLDDAEKEARRVIEMEEAPHDGERQSALLLLCDITEKRGRSWNAFDSLARYHPRSWCGTCLFSMMRMRNHRLVPLFWEGALQELTGDRR